MRLPIPIQSMWKNGIKNSDLQEINQNFFKTQHTRYRHQEYYVESNIHCTYFPIFNRIRLPGTLYKGTYTRCGLRYRRNIQASPVRFLRQIYLACTEFEGAE